MASRGAERERYLFWNYPVLGADAGATASGASAQGGQAPQMVLIPRQESEGQHPRPKHKRTGKGGSELLNLGPSTAEARIYFARRSGGPNDTVLGRWTGSEVFGGAAC